MIGQTQPQLGEQLVIAIGEVIDTEIPIIPSAFTFTVDTNNGTYTPDDSFALPLTALETYNFTVNWGDGTSQVVNTSTPPAEIVHQYPAQGFYQVELIGVYPSIKFLNGGDKLKVTNLRNWGDNAWTQVDGMFHGCSNMIATAKDASVIPIVVTAPKSSGPPSCQTPAVGPPAARVG